MKFVLGLVLGFAVGWFFFGEPAEPNVADAELIEVEILD